MSSMSSSLEQFLQSEAFRKLADAGKIRIREYNPLTREEMEDFDPAELDGMSRDDLEELSGRAEDLLYDLVENEPEDGNNEEYREWQGRLSDIEEFYELVGDRLDEMDEEY